MVGFIIKYHDYNFISAWGDFRVLGFDGNSCGPWGRWRRGFSPSSPAAQGGCGPLPPGGPLVVAGDLVAAEVGALRPGSPRPDLVAVRLGRASVCGFDDGRR
jgi:hypothetical protein